MVSEGPREPLLLVTNVYRPVVGGISTYLANMAEGLRGRYDVRVVAYPAALVRLEASGHPSPLRYLNHILFAFLVAARVLLLRARGRRPIVHSHSASFCLLGAFLAMQLGARAVHTFHSPPTRNSLIIRWLSPRVDALVFVSPALRHLYSEVTGAHNAYEVIIPGAVGIPEASAPEDRRARREALERSHGIPADAPLVLFVGRVVEDKGVHVLAQAASRLGPSGVYTVVVGPSGAAEKDHRYLDHVMELAGESAAAGQFRVLGSIPDEKLEDLLDACDIVVVPSIWPEPAPMVAAEAMAHGRPVVASQTGGLPFLIPDGQAGLLVPAGDPEALIAAVRQIEESPSLRQQLEEGARAQAELRHSIEAFSSEHSRLYASL
jgi:glycosyltransferase involved in cell wall biosynthesis